MGDGKLVMKKRSVVSEHEKLVGLLRSGSKTQLTAEAADQATELARYRRTKGRTVTRQGSRR
jgi:hypothetical protein